MTDQIRLEELATEAAINASKAMSKLSGQQVMVEISKIEVTKVRQTFPGVGPESMVVGVYLPVTGEIKGASLLIFPEKLAYALCDLLVRRKPGTTHNLTELDKSALKEVGNIICGSFLTVFSNTLKVKIIENVPSLSFDMFGAVTDQVMAQFAKKAEEALVIEVKFEFEHTDVKGYVILIFGIEEMKALVNILGVKF